MKFLEQIGTIIKTVAGYVGKKTGDIGGTAALAAGTTINALGGRKFFYAFWLTPVFVIVAHVMKISPANVQFALGIMAGAIGVEGAADFKERTTGGKQNDPS